MAPETARLHLAKAREFLDAAEVELEMELFNAATSSAVTSGINSKDAICLRLTGRSNRSDDHGAAVKELERAGPVGKQLAAAFRRLLSLKSRSQYQATSVARGNATDAVKWAQRMYDQARAVVDG